MEINFIETHCVFLIELCPLLNTHLFYRFGSSSMESIYISILFMITKFEGHWPLYIAVAIHDIKIEHY